MPRVFLATRLRDFNSKHTSSSIILPTSIFLCSHTGITLCYNTTAYGKSSFQVTHFAYGASNFTPLTSPALSTQINTNIFKGFL